MLKWPNDVLLDGPKLAGILVERVETTDGPVAVVGIGVNIAAAPEGAASLAARTGPDVIDPEAVIAALVDRLSSRYEAWRGQDGDPAAWLAAAYGDVCDTLGREVRADLPGGATSRSGGRHRRRRPAGAHDGNRCGGRSGAATSSTSAR